MWYKVPARLMWLIPVVGSMFSFIRTLKRWGTLLVSDNQAVLSFEFDGRMFSQPRLQRRKLGRTASKAGRLSWVAFMDERPVKIYECHSEAQATFIQQVSEHPKLRNYFPTCLARTGVYLVVDWVQGSSLTWKQIRRDKNLLNQTAKIQATIHAQALEMPEAFGCYYMGFLKSRLQHFKGIFPIDDAIQKIYATLDGNTFLAEERISHPDLTADNLILENGTGALKIIDNELLTQNSYYLIDLFNTHKSFGQRLERELLEPYLVHYVENGGDLTLLAEHEQFFCALWYLRLIGSFLQAGTIGTIERAFRLAQEYVEGHEKAHPLVQLVKRRFVQ